MRTQSAVILGMLLTGSLALAAQAPQVAPASSAAAPEAPAQANTELARLAASLKPGQWAELNTQGLTKEMTQTSKTYSIFGWSDDGVWDPVTEQFLFMGFRQEYKFIAYRASTNAWQSYPAIECKQTFGHPYGNNAIDPANGIFYTLECGTDRIHAFDTRKGTWTALPPIPFKHQGLALSIEFFPEKKALIFLYHHQAYAYDPATNKWTEWVKNIPSRPDHVLFHYNPKHKCLLLIGGKMDNCLVAVIDAQGKIAAKKNAPVEIGMGSAYNTAVPDPATGDVIVSSVKDDTYAYDLAADEWHCLGKTAEVTPLRLGCPIGAALPKYGVTMWVEGYSASARHVWLYRHQRPAK